MNLSSPATSRRVAIAVAIALLALAGLVAAAPASASSSASAKAKGCAGKVVADWYDHKDKVHGHYPLHCYREALDSLDNNDVGIYTNAKEAISAALALEALRCKSNCGPTDPGSGTGRPKLKPGEQAITYHNTYDFSGDPPVVNAVPVSSSSPSAVPLPLIVLAALAAVLLIAGAGSYIARRLKASRATPPATDTPS